MKRLRIKVFITIFLILSLFCFNLLLFSNFREYKKEKKEIKNVLNRDYRRKDIFGEDSNDHKSYEIFVDFKVYTVKLKNNDIEYIISSVYDDEKNLEKVKKIVKLIITTSKKKEDINLISKTYSYSYVDDKTLFVVDNTTQTNIMKSYMASTVLLFTLIEMIAFIISKILTKWIAKPVEESFNREKRFIGDASHELKTPIAVIMASADTFLNDNDKKWIDNIKTESERMSKLIKELLNLNQLENNIQNIEKKDTDFSKLIETSLLSYESLFYENNIKYSYDVSKNIKLSCNSELIKELISILIDNAIKYSSEKGIVNVKLYKDKDIYLTVSNKGVAIKDKDKEKIFERFYKVDKSRNRDSNHYGLGLPIAKKIVEIHDGDISVNSNKGITSFTVKFLK